MRQESHRLARRYAMRASHMTIAMALGASLGLAHGAQAQDKPVKSQGRTSAPRAKEAAVTDAGPVQVEEVIVTGVMAATNARKANVSYSVLNEDDMSKFTPISADDMLRDMPGVVVESNDGVARNEVFTRGMTVGTGSNTSGYYWATILEDGLPVVPQKFGGFQDGYFYRADISTSKVESVRGGSSATGVTSSIGATFNFLSGKVRPGASIQTRIGFEGEDSHLSWKQVDGYYGWLNKAGDLGFSLNGFYRTSTGQVDPGYKLNDGGQVKATLFKSYEGLGGAGTINVTVKHLDDTNSSLTNFVVPAYGYDSFDPAPGWGRDVDLFIRGGKHRVPFFNREGSQEHDPEKGYRYKQDAVWLRWEHSTAGRWSFTGALRLQKSSVFGEQYGSGDVTSLAASNGAREKLGLNINNLDRTPGFYEFYDMATGALRARVANNVGGSQLGVDYRTSQACPRVTSLTAPGRCVTFNDLPNRDFDLRGGLVTSTRPDIVNGVPTYYTGVVPDGGANRDLIMTTKAEFTDRSSEDVMGNFTATYAADGLNLNFGLYAAQSRQKYLSWGNGLGVSAWGDGEVANLDVRYVTVGGTSYQLTDEGGWGQLGGGFGTFFQWATVREISPYFGIAWSPTEHWDFNASIKHSRFNSRSYSEIWDTRNPGAGSLANGGLDGNPLTVYDNIYFIRTEAKNIRADKSVGITNYSASIGYNFNRGHKVYYRYTDSGQGVVGAIQRYRSAADLTKPLGPNHLQKGHELAYTFAQGKVNGQVTMFYTRTAFTNFRTAKDVDGVTDYLLPETVDRYMTRGVEAWARWKISRNLDWSTSLTFNNGKAMATVTYLTNANGPADDTYFFTSGIMSRTPRWAASNTLSYKYKDWRFNLRHRWMDERKVAVDPLDKRYLPQQDNFDLSAQYAGLKDTRISLDVRNVFSSNYVSAYDTLIGGVWPRNVQKYDIADQLPNSAIWIKNNTPRSFWLTVKHDF
jgi:hypothetical protein